jgi:hypothetical protein
MTSAVLVPDALNNQADQPAARLLVSRCQRLVVAQRKPDPIAEHVGSGFSAQRLQCLHPAARPPAARAALALLTLLLLAAGELRADDEFSVEVHIPRPGPEFVPWKQKYYDYVQGTLGGVFRRTCDQGLAGAPEAAKVLDRLAAAMSDLPGAPSWDELTPQIAPLARLPWQHPILLYAFGVSQPWQEGGPDLSMDYYTRSWEAYASGDYPLVRRFWAVQRIVDRRLRRDLSAQALTWMEDWIRCSVQLLHDPSLADPVARSLICEWVAGNWSTAYAEGRRRAALLAEIAKGGVDPWLADMITGRIELSRAWAERGGHSPIPGAQEDHQAFLDHLDRAQRAFSAAWARDATVPDAASAMIEVAMAGGAGLEQEVRWFERALSVQMDSDDAWDALFQALGAEWGGGQAAILSVGRQALASGAFTTGTPEFMLRAIALIPRSQRDAAAVPPWSDERVHADLVGMFEGYLAEPSCAGLRDWYLTRYAGCMWRCGAREEVRAILARIHAPISARLFSGCAGDELETVQQSLAAGGR